MHDNVRCASVAAVIVLALSGGASAMFESRDTKLQAVKTVGIISAIGDQFTLARAGLTGLDNSSRSFPISSWGLDDLIIQQTTADAMIAASYLSFGNVPEWKGVEIKYTRKSATK